MKKKILFVIIISFCFIFTSCKKQENLSNNYQTTTTTKNNVAYSSNKVIEKLEIKQIDKIIDNYKKINSDKIRFISNLKENFNNALPTIMFFEYPYIYYDCMSTIIKDDPDESKLYLGRYCIDTNEKETFDSIDFNAMSNSAQLLMDNNKYMVYSPCKIDKNGQLIMDTVLFNLEENKSEIVFSYPVGNVFTYVKQLNDNEFIVFFYLKDNDKFKQRIVKYNVINKEPTVIYKGKEMSWESELNSTRDIWAVDTEKNEIYLILHQLVNGKMKTFIQILDNNGNKIRETELMVPEKYDSKYCTISDIEVKCGYVFINYQTLEGESSLVIFKEQDDSYIQLEYIGERPRKLLNQNLIDSRYLYFSTFNGKLFVFDLQEEKGISLNIDIDSISLLKCDSRGNIIVVTKDTENDNIFLINKNDILKTIKNE